MKNKILTEKEIKQVFIQTFEEVKNIVKISQRQSRAGLMLGFQELGSSMNGIICAYYPVASNIIVVNQTPLRRINETKPELLKPYGFHILLHEYIHSLGFLNEAITKQKTYEISKENFGEKHIITQLSTNITKFFPNLVYPIYGWIPPESTPPINIIKGFDKSNTQNYIT